MWRVHSWVAKCVTLTTIVAHCGNTAIPFPFTPRRTLKFISPLTTHVLEKLFSMTYGIIWELIIYAGVNERVTECICSVRVLVRVYLSLYIANCGFCCEVSKVFIPLVQRCLSLQDPDWKLDMAPLVVLCLSSKSKVNEFLRLLTRNEIIYCIWLFISKYYIFIFSICVPLLIL